MLRLKDGFYRWGPGASGVRSRAKHTFAPRAGGLLAAEVLGEEVSQPHEEPVNDPASPSSRWPAETDAATTNHERDAAAVVPCGR